MTPAERLQAAIKKLEALKAESTPGPWLAWKKYDPLRGEVYGIEWEAIDIIAVRSYNAADADLIATLHRTIDAQLPILRSALGDAEGSHDEPGAFELAVGLADAILGAAS